MNANAVVKRAARRINCCVTFILSIFVGLSRSDDDVYRCQFNFRTKPNNQIIESIVPVDERECFTVTTKANGID